MSFITPVHPPPPHILASLAFLSSLFPPFPLHCSPLSRPLPSLSAEEDGSSLVSSRVAQDVALFSIPATASPLLPRFDGYLSTTVRSTPHRGALCRVRSQVSPANPRATQYCAHTFLRNSDEMLPEQMPLRRA
ncbi:hypothetical protein PMAYCL1PPCAC_04460 [Pristionchus mayeri]|uniref:Uncharacterized protein n=1 Tax=Pristionchus mayeri TaxID=1317129 RepID=A0AAN5C845_9BILA|nr:hypothetical protein PMAYCL1PPCAC_04460 [Pristionchus mayeri]